MFWVVYKNACVAQKNGLESFTEGACNARVCPRIYAPVCSADLLTYANACEAERAGARIKYAGLCEEQGKNCPNVYQPVCGIDKHTYDNKCLLENAGTKLAYAGMCLGQ